ncbi:uncharacterized protein LOC124957613 isoform X2 [Vespa velutina]|uniref:uncharacterized protein LOC124957613 isoform X2 n=1 Tax=Vespa velutina TaxID=202808 RepID=UPI001FB3A73A|nr:uncharacterized protein LOC124957613 isoform X2 [Vespa velutina]
MVYIYINREMMALPIEIWEQIFLYVDTITLTKLKVVCNSWREIIDKILKERNFWYKKCKEEISQNIWSLLFETLYPNRSYVDLKNAKKEGEIWMNMYKWWTKCKKLTNYNIFLENLDPLPKYHFQEIITCTAVLGTSKGYIYFYNIDALNNKPIYVANHMEFLYKIKFLKNSRKIILVSSCINGHIKFWDLESKELIKKDHGKLLSTSQSYCYTVIKNTLIVQGCIPRTLYELPVDEIVAGAADGNKISFYTKKGHFINVQLAEGEEVFITEFVKPPKLYIRDYYMFTNIAVCITEHGHLGFSIHGGKWKFHNILPIFHGTPTAVLVYAHLLVLGLNSGHVCIYCVENWNILDLNSTLARLIILDTEPIISLNISAHFKERIIAASIKRVHFIHFT